jgi:prephenate dehydrogenase
LAISHPVIGIVGSAGAYGRWLRTFFTQRMQLRVLGYDPADPASNSEADVLEQADVLLFSAPIRQTTQLIQRYVENAAGREAGKLWLDVTSIKSAPVAAMLQSQADVVGLHPMTAPPKSPTLRGRVMVVCEARLTSAWRPWLATFLAASQAECVSATPEQHDRVMALVQGMVHATHLAQAGVLRNQAAHVGDLLALMPFRSASFEMDAAIMARILSLNPAIYEDIQFGNPYTQDVLDVLASQFQQLSQWVKQGDDDARAQFRAVFLAQNKAALGAQALAESNYTYERVGYLLADLADARTMSVHLPEDRPGSLRALLHVFEAHDVSIASLHSSRTQAGELHFRFGFTADTRPEQLDAVKLALMHNKIGRVLSE